MLSGKVLYLGCKRTRGASKGMGGVGCTILIDWLSLPSGVVDRVLSPCGMADFGVASFAYLKGRRSANMAMAQAWHGMRWVSGAARYLLTVFQAIGAHLSRCYRDGFRSSTTDPSIGLVVCSMPLRHARPQC